MLRTKTMQFRLTGFMLLFCLTLNQVWAQTPFAGSFTGLNPGASTPPTITNLTVSALSLTGVGTNAGANRYNTTSWDAGGASENVNKYISFTITPAAGYKATLTNLNITAIQSSGTGPTKLQVKYVLNGGTPTNIGGVYSFSASASQVAGPSYANLDIEIPAGGSLQIRVYAFGGSGTGGTFSFNGSNPTIIGTVSSAGPELPKLTLPVATNIKDVTATLGATLSDTGGAVITARGIVWSTAANPTIGGAGVTQVAESVGGLGAFTTTASSLPAGTRIYFKGYATNNVGTGYSAEGSFYTLSSPPNGHVTDLTATAISNHDIQLSWTPVANADGYIVLQKIYTAPTTFPVNATRYTQGNQLGDADIIGVITNGSASGTTSTGLVSGTIYQYAVIPYRFNGTNIETYNYYTTPVVPVAFDTTLGVGPSASSDIVGTYHSEAAAISSVINDTLHTDTNGIKVWQLAVRDGGSLLSDADDMPTIVNRLVIKKGTNNTVDNWQQTIQYVALFDDSAALKIADGIIYKDSFVFSNILLQAADDNFRTYTLNISLKKTNIRDNDTLQFSIERNNIVTPGLTVSSQIPALDIQSDSVRNKIVVIPTRFVITQQPPAVVRINTLMSPALKVELEDVNGNKAIYYNEPVHLYSSVATLNSSVAKIPVMGQVIFDSVSFTELAKNNKLQIVAQGVDTAYSNEFNIFASDESDIVATSSFVYTDSIPYLDYQEKNNLTVNNSVAVFGFTLRDGGATLNDADTFGTFLSRIAFSIQGNQFIRRVALFNGNDKLAEANVDTAVIAFANLNIKAADNDSLNLTLRASFNSRNAHGQRIAFTVNSAEADTAQGSLFALANAGGAASITSGSKNVLKYTTVFVPAPIAVNTTACKDLPAILTATKTTDGQLYWYASLAASTPVHVGDTFSINTLTATTTYYAEQDSAGFRSNRTAVTASVITITHPLVSDEAVCKNSTTTLTATSNNPVLWFRNVLTSTVLFSGNSFATGTISSDTLFYVQADSSGCKSNRVQVRVNIKSVTLPEVKDTVICKGNALTLTANNIPGLTINWYDAAHANQPLQTGPTFTTGNVLSNTVFYISSDSAGCVSERKAVHVSVKTINKPTFVSDSVTICSGNQTTLIAGNTANNIVKWYDAESSNTAVFVGDTFETPVLSTTTIYYAAATDNHCSSEKIAVKVNVTQMPVTPLAATDSICSGSSAVLSVASSSVVKWYNALSGGNLLFTGNTYQTGNLTTNTVYYVETSNQNCYSARIPFSIGVKAKPAAPATVNATAVCAGNTTKVWTSAANTYWYANANDTVNFAVADTLVTTILQQNATYYAAVKSANGCVSDKKAVTVTVNPIPDASFAVNAAEQCFSNNQFVFMNVANVSGVVYKWNFGDETISDWSNPVKTYNKEGSYTVSLKATSVKGCFAETSKTVVVTTPPDVDFDYTAQGSTATFETNLTDIIAYKWHFTTTDTSIEANPVFTFAEAGNYVVTLSITDNRGCRNTISKVVHVFGTALGETLASAYKLNVYPNPVVRTAQVSYTLKNNSAVNITLYDAKGSLVKQIVNEKQEAGVQQIAVDMENLTGNFYLLKVGINGTYGTVKLLKE